MNKPRYKAPSLQRLHERMLAAARDRDSELYYEGKPHRSGAQHAVFWDGYAGVTKSSHVVPGTPSAACFTAGQLFAKTNPGIPVEEAIAKAGVTHQIGN